jgi:uncharacterized protein (TIGR03083 family)
VDVNPDRHSLLGAYALDALDDDEAAAVDALVAEDPRARQELGRLLGAAAWIGATEALTPPRDLRAQLLQRATPISDEVRAYRAAMRRHEELLDSLGPDVLDRPTTNGLNVGELVVHLASMESAVAETVGLEQEITDETDVEARTRRYLEVAGEDPLGDGRRRWREAVDALDAWAMEGGERGGLPWSGLAVSRRTLLTSRAFETWTHDDDIRDALGRDRVVPQPVELGVMSELAVTILPLCLAATGATVEAAARLVLTGDGGGDWTVSLDGAAHDAPAVTITLDVVDYCRVVADRLGPEPEVCGATLEGDEQLGRTLLACASALATL